MEAVHKIKVGIFADDLNRKAMGTATVLQKTVATYLDHFQNEVEVILIHRTGGCTHSLCEVAQRAEVRIFHSPKFSGFFSYAYFFLFTKERFDVIHFLRPSLHPLFWFLKLFRKTKKIIVTFHGAPESKKIPIFTTGFTKVNRLLIRIVGKYFIDTGIVDAKAALEPVEKYYSFPKEKLATIYLGVDEIYKSLSEDRKNIAQETLKEKYRIPFPYILAVSRLDPHKNVHRLIEAFGILKKENNIPHHLVIVGGRHEPIYSDRVESLVKELELEKYVYFTPYIDEEDMPKVYSLSDLFVFVSLSEGFGLPLIEAMACEVPIIASNISALPEVAGGAAVLVDPYDKKDIADKCLRLLNKKELRADLLKKGKIRAAEFSWKKTAKETIQLYREVLNT